MGGRQGTPGAGQLIPKEVFMQILTEFKQSVMTRLLEAKKQNIEERMRYYKQDLEQYKTAVMSFMSIQQKLSQEVLISVVLSKGATVEDLNKSLMTYMADPDVQPKLLEMQTISGDFCEGQPVPDTLTRERFLEIVRLQTEELRKYTINSPVESMLAQSAASDEVNLRFGYDEITQSAAIIKFENLVDPELASAREEWNEVSKINNFMPGMQGGGGEHVHGPGCSHQHGPGPH